MNRCLLSFLALWFLLPGALASADGGRPIRTGQVLPYVELSGSKQGAVQLDGDDIHYIAWSTQELTGKPRIVYHLAGRLGIDQINGHIFDALTELEIDPAAFVTLTLLNGGDVTLAASGMARREFEKNKRKYPAGEFVFDADSTAQQSWQLQRKTSAVILVNNEGVVLFFGEGKIPDDEAQHLIELVKNVSGHQGSYQVPGG